MTVPGDLASGHKLTLKGKGILTAWQPGVIEALMRGGKDLPDAMRAATRMGMAVHEVERPNLITSSGKALVGDFLIDEEDGGITYCAIGTVSTAPGVADTALGGEVHRNSITSRTRAANEVTLSTFFLAADATYSLEEVGWFGGTAAGTVADSGTIFSHILQSYDNSSGDYDLTYEYVLTIDQG